MLSTVTLKVSEHVEPLDARKTRALTLENMKLTREVERLRGHQGEAEQLKRELTRARSKLEEEKSIRGNIQVGFCSWSVESHQIGLLGSHRCLEDSPI